MNLRSHEIDFPPKTVREVTFVAGESIMIGENVTVTILETVGDEVRLCVEGARQDDGPA